MMQNCNKLSLWQSSDLTLQELKKSPISMATLSHIFPNKKNKSICIFDKKGTGKKNTCFWGPMDSNPWISPPQPNRFPKRNWSFTGGAKNFRRCLEGNKQTFNCVCVCLFSIGKTYHISLFGGDIVVFLGEYWFFFSPKLHVWENKYVCYKNGFIFPLKFGVIFFSNIWSFTTQIYALDRYFSPTSCCLRKRDHETCTLHAWWKNRQPMIVDHSP